MFLHSPKLGRLSRTLPFYPIQAGPQPPSTRSLQDSQIMQLSGIVPILFVFIFDVCVSPLYIGSSENSDIQAIPKLIPRDERIPLPKTMKELVKKVGPKLTISSQDLFDEHCKKRVELRTGKQGYPSFIYDRGYKAATAIPGLDAVIPAIIKGIWTTRIRKENQVTEKAVIDGAFHHKISGDSLAFGINPSPSGYRCPQDPPDFFVIIKNKGYSTLQVLELAGLLTKAKAYDLRYIAKTKIQNMYTSDSRLGFLDEESYLYEPTDPEVPNGEFNAVYI